MLVSDLIFPQIIELQTVISAVIAHRHRVLVFRSVTMESDSLQARFFTKEKEFSMPQDPISLELDVTPEQLNLLINELLGRAGDTLVEFGFLIQENIILGSLREHLQENDISAETLIEVRLPRSFRFFLPESYGTLD